MTFCKIRSRQKLGNPSLICRNIKDMRKVLLNHGECIKMNETRRILIHRTVKIEIQKEGPNDSHILQNWYPSEIRSHVFNL